MLLRQDWPGNVRELEKIIQRAVVFTDKTHGSLENEDFIGIAGNSLSSSGSSIPSSGSSILVPRGLTLKELSELYIRDTLKSTGNNRTRAAELLGISLRKLQYDLKDIKNRTAKPEVKCT